MNVHPFLQEIGTYQWISASKIPNSTDVVKEFDSEEISDRHGKRPQLYEEWARRKLKERLRGKLVVYARWLGKTSLIRMGSSRRETSKEIQTET
jgi:hypothetical protein